MALTLTHDEAIRFVDKLRVTDTGCWEWIGGKTTGNRRSRGDKGGYGKFNLRGRTMLAHRVMYAAVHGVIEHEVDHLCRNRACVRPRCLEDVTSQVNAHRSSGFASTNAHKTVCVNGHPYTPENTLQQKGGRECRQCRQEIYRRYRRRKRAQVAS